MMLHELTLNELTAKLAAGEVSSREAMQACLDRIDAVDGSINACLLYTSPSPRDRTRSRMPSSA